MAFLIFLAFGAEPVVEIQSQKQLGQWCACLKPGEHLQQRIDEISENIFKIVEGLLVAGAHWVCADVSELCEVINQHENLV